MFDPGLYFHLEQQHPVQVVSGVPEISAAVWDPYDGAFATWEIGDSGSGALLGRTDWVTGETWVYDLALGVENTDWEAMVPGRASTESEPATIWILDVGDNKAKREDVRFYEIELPRPTEGDVAFPSLRRTIVGRFPTGARNVEAALTGMRDGVTGAYLIEKRKAGGEARLAWVDFSEGALEDQVLDDVSKVYIPFSVTDAALDGRGGAFFLTYVGVYGCEHFSHERGDCEESPKRLWSGFLGQQETILSVDSPARPDRAETQRRAIVANEDGEFYEIGF